MYTLNLFIFGFFISRLAQCGSVCCSMNLPEFTTHSLCGLQNFLGFFTLQGILKRLQSVNTAEAAGRCMWPFQTSENPLEVTRTQHQLPSDNGAKTVNFIICSFSIQSGGRECIPRGYWGTICTTSESLRGEECIISTTKTQRWRALL